ncbi:MAG: trypsin-like peptidase domain-containing protein [Bacteroidales bacterium]|nr:trypsin-like peptidase domain-containing protein [Bacteroidales bacterium]
MKKGIITVLLSVLVSGLTAYAIVKTASPAPSESQEVVYSQDGQTVRTVNLSLSDYPDFTYAAETAVEAVVYVKVTIQSRQSSGPSPMDDLFRYFFGEDPYGGRGYRGGQAPARQGSGSGVIIRPDGYIVTNNHVVENASTIEVTLNNNKTYEATVVGTDPATDVALIKIDATGLPTVQFADSDQLRLGEWVLAIGSPLGEELRSTITAGIVSAKGRSMPNYDGQFKIESFIQTDAAVNPGNSGGALVNKQGELVGINTAIVSTTGSFAGYSFAVPSNIVKKVVSDLIDFGSVKRAMLGISGATVTEEIIKQQKLDVKAPEGVYVDEVVSGGAADKAGVKSGDVIVSIDGTKTATMPELQAKVNSYHPGDKATVKALRGGKEVDFTVSFTDGNVADGTVSSEGTVAFYGAQLKAAENGVLIVSAGNGKLARAGGEDGFVIRFVNDQKVSKPQDVIDIAKKSKRSIFIEGVTANGRPGYFGFGKDE